MHSTERRVYDLTLWLCFMNIMLYEAFTGTGLGSKVILINADASSRMPRIIVKQAGPACLPVCRSRSNTCGSRISRVPKRDRNDPPTRPRNGRFWAFPPPFESARLCPCDLIKNNGSQPTHDQLVMTLTRKWGGSPRVVLGPHSHTPIAVS
jgi:hypothetical protein